MGERTEAGAVDGDGLALHGLGAVTGREDLLRHAHCYSALLPVADTQHLAPGVALLRKWCQPWLP